MRDWLLSLRRERGMTMKDMAEKLCISESYYCMIESGLRQKRLTLKIAQSIADAFGVPIEEIIRLEREAQDAQHKDSA